MSLAHLIKYAPNVAGGYMAEQHTLDSQKSRLDQQMTLADIVGKHQTNDFNAQNNPLKLEQQRLTNRGLEVELPGKAADAEGRVLDTRKKRDTYQTDVDAINSNNEITVMGNNLKKYTQISEVFTTAAQEVQKLPPMMRGVRVKEILEQHGLKTDTPQARRLLMEVSENPQALIQRAEQAKIRAAQLTPAYIQAMAQEDARGKNQLANTRLQGESSVRVAEINRDGRVAAAQARSAANSKIMSIYDQVRSGKLKAPEMPAAFTFEARAARAAGKEEEAQFYEEEAKRAGQMLLDRNNAKTVQTLQNGEIVPSTPQNPYAAPSGGAQVAPPEIANALRAANMPYEPDKYEYRVGPNGKAQRKAK